jgi:signal transduction histidine kinase
VLLGLPGTTLAMWVTDDLKGAVSFGSALLLALGVSLVSLLITLWVAVPKAAQLDQENLERANEELRWLVARSNAEMWQKQRSLSTFLHGQVQNSISAAVIRFDMARSAQADIASATAEARSVSTSAIDSIANPPETYLLIQNSFEQIVSGWNGVCEVTIELSEDLQNQINSDPSCSRVTVDIVQESISNAIRHGQAKRVSVQIQPLAATEIQIQITNDGLALAGDPATGLGTQLLNDCAISWSRENSDAGVSVLCQVPLTASIVESVVV